VYPAVLALGGFLALLLTPPFALSYYAAYALPSESPPIWLASLQAPLVAVGLVEPGSPAAYKGYGLLYLVAWLVGLIGLIGVLATQWPRFTGRLRRAWAVVAGCLIVIAVGILGDYGLPESLGELAGYAATVIGFILSIFALGVLGWRFRRELGSTRRLAWLIGSLGFVSVVGGMALVGHIPSGPGIGFALAALIAGIVRPWRFVRWPDPRRLDA
jgi:hypothetical protein